MNVKAIIFDLDNTLTHRNQTIEHYSQVLLSYFNLMNHADNLNEIQTIIQKIDCGGYPKRENLTYPSIAASVAHALIQTLEWDSAPSLEFLTDFWFEYFPKSAVKMPDANELLVHLKNEGYQLSIISNGQHESRLRILNALGFTDFFDEIVSSEKAGVRKPEAEIFRKTCDLLQVKPQQCLFIGDHPVNDYAGAKSVGMHALLLEGFHPVEDQDMIKIKRLNDAIAYLK